MITRTKNIFKMFIVVMQVLPIIATNSWAYKEATHQAINECIAKNLSGQVFSLDDYLKKQLGMQNGINTYFGNKMIFKWISDGGSSEDNSVRFLNHFYNPLNKTGLNVYFWQWNWWVTGKPVIDWALMPIGIQGIDGNYSWSDARYNYYLALINHQGMRGSNFAETCRALGQLMHLVEDMSVPAHTRNDWHPINEGYESWAKYYVKSVNDFVSNYSPAFFQPSDSVNVYNLFDTNQYTGSNPDVTSQGNIGLSEFTNANFFSDNTIDSTAFPSPKNDLTQTLTINGYPYFIRQCGNCPDTNASRAGRPGYYLLSTVDYSSAWGIYSYDQPAFPILDNYVFRDYAQFLMPRAVGYSSELLGYFFRGKMKVKMLPVFNSDQKLQQVYVKIRNITPTKETMGGPNKSYFVLSYRYTPTGAPSDGSLDKWITSNGIYLPKTLPYGLDNSGNDLKGDDYEIQIIFDDLDQLPDPVPKECYDSVKFMLTYMGDLGDENMVLEGGYITKIGAVMGKSIPAKQIIFGEEWATYPNGDNHVWYMSNDSAGNVVSTTFCNAAWCTFQGSGMQLYYYSCGDSSCNNPLSCFDAIGKAKDGVVGTNGGSLIMDNIRYAVPNCNPSSQDAPGHCNVSMIGHHSLSEDTYNPLNSTNNYIFPIPITENTYIEFQIDEMSISPTPPETGYALAYQVLEFYFNNGLMLQFSLEDQGIDWENPNLTVGYFTFDPGTIAVGNIYELFKEWYPDMTIPRDLKLNYIHLTQQTLWNLPCNIEFAQRMSINSVRVVEMAPTE